MEPCVERLGLSYNNPNVHSVGCFGADDASRIWDTNRTRPHRRDRAECTVVYHLPTFRSIQRSTPNTLLSSRSAWGRGCHKDTPLS